MSEHTVNVLWERATEDFEVTNYNRDHIWELDNGETIEVSAAPDYFGNPSMIDPEQALVGALSSCHMLTFLALASKKGYVINEYVDQAVGYLEKGPEGFLMITRVNLRPEITFEGESPDQTTMNELHHKAHKHCFIANSVKTKILLFDNEISQ